MSPSIDAYHRLSSQFETADWSFNTHFTSIILTVSLNILSQMRFKFHRKTSLS